VIRSSHSAVRRWLSGQRGGDAALDVAGATDPESVSRVVATTAWTAILYGTLPEAVAASAAAMELIERRPELLWTTYASAAIGIRARALAYNGRVDEAEELSLRVLEAARATGQVELEGWANGWRANTLLARGHVQEALRHARRDLEIAETLGSPMSRVTARWICGDVGSVLGLWAETEHWGQEGIDILRMHHVAVELEASFLTFWAEGLAGRGESARAQELIAEAIAKTESLGSRFLGFRAHLGLARILMWTSAPVHAEAIEAALRTAEQFAHAIGLASSLPWVYEERAALALALGDREAQRAHLEEARRLYEKIGASGHLERLAGKPAKVDLGVDTPGH